jgi:hypothetical protein
MKQMQVFKQSFHFLLSRYHHEDPFLFRQVLLVCLDNDVEFLDTTEIIQNNGIHNL